MNTHDEACSNRSKAYTNAAVIYARVNVYDLPICPSAHLAYNTCQIITQHIDNQLVECVFLIASKHHLSPTTGGKQGSASLITHCYCRLGAKEKE